MRTSKRRVASALLALVTLAVAVGCTSKAPVITGPGKITIRYGPYTIPASTPTRMGMIQNNFQFGIDMPCKDCYLTGMQAGLINPNGTNANVDQGLWLHHMVILNTGATDTTCGKFGPAAMGERFFSSGNERTPTNAIAGSGLYGYPAKSGDSWNLIYDLMNMTATAKPVYITVTYDYVPLNTPGYKPMKPVWLDVNQCLTSEVAPKQGKYNYQYNWMVTLPGKLLGIGGHMHDGGTDVQILQNGAEICDSVPTYGGSPEYIEGSASIHMPGMPHISKMSTCAGTATQPLATLKNGDQIKLIANYDSNAHMQMGNEPIMGIAIGYVDPS